MNKPRLEQLAAEALERERRGERAEDDRVELKRELPDADAKTARHIAGLANAARGEEFVLAVDILAADGSTVPQTRELSAWWDQIASNFDGEPPSPEFWHSSEQLLIGFDTSAAPYVVKTRQTQRASGEPEYEVPWRRNNSTRTARRSDLVRLLVPQLRTPEVDVLRARLELDYMHPNWGAKLVTTLFLTPLTPQRVALPAHRARADFDTLADMPLHDEPAQVSFRPIDGSLVHAAGRSQVYADAPGPVDLVVRANLIAELCRPLSIVRASLELPPAPDGPPVRLRILLKQVPGHVSSGAWTLDGQPG